MSSPESDSSSDEESENEDEFTPGKAPSDIELENLIIDVEFHPKRDVIASCMIDGNINIHSYNAEGTNHQLMNFSHHKKACRGLSFSEDGQLLFSISKDKSFVVTDMETGAIVHNIQRAHLDPIYSLLVIDNYLVATGDDEGKLKLWDYRKETAIMELNQIEEFISDMVIDESKKKLFVASGEGSLTVVDVRKKQMVLQSELFESEFLCLDIVKNGSKVVVGAGDGVVNIFNWGEWGNISDRFPLPQVSIDSLVAVNDDVICTGSMDGVIRAVNILPNRIAGIVGKHEDFPIENLSISNDGTYLASCSHDLKIKFWNIECLDHIKEHPNKKPTPGNDKKILTSKADNFFAGLAD